MLLTKLFLLLSAVLVVSGCQTSPKSEVDVTAEVFALENAQKTLDLGRFAESKILFKDFQFKYPQTKYLYASKIGEMDSYIGLGEYDEAVKIGRDIIVKNITDNSAIAALVMYKLSFAYEAMGDEAKAVSSLLDAKKYATDLPPFVAYAEIPARLASLYARQYRTDEVNQYLDEAEKGIERLRATSLDREMPWLGKTYVQMGLISTNQLSSDNYENVVASQKAVQKYLLRALKLNDARWSEQALLKLRENYGAFSMQISLEKDADRRSQLAGDFYDLIAESKLYRPRKISNKFESEFFQYLAILEKDTERVIYSNTPRNFLTPESESLNSLKRAGPMKNGRALPAGEKSSITTPYKVIPSEDPNL